MSTTKWALDPTHSEINFKIKHMMISNVTGSFTNFNVTAETDGDNFANSKVSFTTEWNAATEAGGLLVGEDLKVQAEIQLVKQA
ncbi:MAG: YceI family protein [Bacteroidetes bacterium]|nr:YceI family protein [Bacteroidota bacterium]